VTRFRDFGEFSFIDRISQHGLARAEGVLCSVGDDCAVLDRGDGSVQLLTTDLLVEDVHFRRDACRAPGLGHKLLAVNLSDIAAMGGSPCDAVVSLAVPADLEVEFAEDVYRGMHACARKHCVNIVGGDTTRSPGPLVMGLTLTGTMPLEAVCYRSGARPGDTVYVSGAIGDSAAGLRLALQHEAETENGDRDYLLDRHHRPEPRVGLGQRLAATAAVTAMIDLSDGVASDLLHVCTQSGVHAVITEEAIPLSAAFRSYCAEVGVQATELALTGGEDYELLFAVRREETDRVEALSEQDGLPLLSRIGYVESGGPTIEIEDADGGRKPLEVSGFDHFRAGGV